jgi:hypothetical protein
MSWQEFVDGYDCKARLIPTVITLLPLFWSAYYLYPDIVRSPLLLAGSGAISVAAIYVGSMFVKDLGVRYAARFWSGRVLPSTQLGRMKDPFFSQEQKNRIRMAVLERLGIVMLDSEEELRNPKLADRQIIFAFREIKELLRQSDKGWLVEKQNAEYSFPRNLCGARAIFVALSVGGIVGCGFKGSWQVWNLNAGSLINLALLVLWVPFAWIALPRMMQLNAETYARRAWITFLTLREESAKKPPSVSGLVEQERRLG